MMKNSIKKSIYAICASVGFASALFTQTAASGSDTVIRHASDILNFQPVVIEEISAKKFSDIDENAWYFPYVDMLVKDGVINGISETEYAPDGEFTIAECCAVIARYLGLEDYAAAAKEELIKASASGSFQWYSGYVQALYDTGIIKDGEFSVTTSNGYVMINDESLFMTPVERHTFAVFITRSFDIDTKKVKAKNLYEEICDNGNNFIVGGRYDGSISLYANDISDFDTIPEESREDVLKAYYNGIFNGDENGNFNPSDLLKRAEMSKVIAVVANSDLRTRKEYRNLSETAVLSEDKFVKDGWKEKVLDRNYSYLLLLEAANSISCDVKAQGIDVGYIPLPAPEGYFYDVRFYTKNGNTYKEASKAPISQNEAMIVKKLDQPRVMILLRNSDNAEIEGALRVDISSDGNVIFDNLFKSVV